MSATEQHVKEQCKRLSSLPMIEPKTPEGKREIKDTLLRNCQSNEHVTEVITRFLEGDEDPGCMPIAALVRIAKKTRRVDEPPPGCHRCGLGPDEFTGEMRWAPHIAIDMGKNYSFASRCDCERGLWFQDRDRESGKPKLPAKAKHKHKADVDWQRMAAGDTE
jgi:hypothetical protein